MEKRKIKHIINNAAAAQDDDEDGHAEEEENNKQIKEKGHDLAITGRIFCFSLLSLSP